MHRMNAICRNDPRILCRNRHDPPPAIGVYTGNDKAAHTGSSSFPHNVRQQGVERFQVEVAMAVDQADRHKNQPNRLTTRSMILIKKPRRS